MMSRYLKISVFAFLIPILCQAQDPVASPKASPQATATPGSVSSAKPNSIFVPFKDLLSKSLHLSNHPSLSKGSDGQSTLTLPTLIVPDEHFATLLKKYQNAASSDGKHLKLFGQETVLLKASELEDCPDCEPKLKKEPASMNVTLSGVQNFDLSSGSTFKPELNLKTLGLPANQFKLGKMTLVIQPVSAGMNTNYPMPTDTKIAPSSSSTKWQSLQGSPKANGEGAANAQSGAH